MIRQTSLQENMENIQIEYLRKEVKGGRKTTMAANELFLGERSTTTRMPSKLLTTLISPPQEGESQDERTLGRSFIKSYMHGFWSLKTTPVTRTKSLPLIPSPESSNWMVMSNWVVRVYMVRVGS